jgi:hypothetical protein
MTDAPKPSFAWIVGLAVLAAVTVAAIVHLRSMKRGDAASAVLQGPSTQLRCSALSPDKFIVAPGGRQEITVGFAGGSGHLSLPWSASGGVLMTTAGPNDKPSLSAHLYVDDFDDGTLDLGLWRSELATDTTLTEKQGFLRAALGNGNEDRVARLETRDVIDGDFAAQVTVRSVSANGNRGAVSLSFVMLGGGETHVQAIAGTGYAALEANARADDGTWRSSASVVYGGGPVNLRLVRVGTTFSCWFDRGSGAQLLGTFTDVSAGAGHVRLETWSLDGHPAVDSEIDNFGAGQNTIVSWQAPSDAAPGNSYVIRLATGCTATALIGSPAH